MQLKPFFKSNYKETKLGFIEEDDRGVKFYLKKITGETINGRKETFYKVLSDIKKENKKGTVWYNGAIFYKEIKKKVKFKIIGFNLLIPKYKKTCLGSTSLIMKGNVGFWKETGALVSYEIYNMHRLKECIRYLILNKIILKQKYLRRLYNFN